MNLLFLVFNRPDLTRKVFARIREAKPKRLFLAADGPRPGREGEAALCAEARGVVEQVDWPCRVETLFRERNLGCRVAVSSAITWFFENVADGIILEDDCLPDLSFFRYSTELLDRYATKHSVMAVGGNCFQRAGFDPGSSYYFSIYPHCWGWATWRRAWEHYQEEMKEWPVLRATDWLLGLHGNTAAMRYWTRIFDQMHENRVDTWDYIWTFTCWRMGGLTALPAVNLVENIGFGPGATHTVESRAETERKRAGRLAFPLHHPRAVEANKRADRYTQRTIFEPQPKLRERLRDTVSNRHWYGKWVRMLPVVGCLWARWRARCQA